MCRASPAASFALRRRRPWPRCTTSANSAAPGRSRPPLPGLHRHCAGSPRRRCVLCFVAGLSLGGGEGWGWLFLDANSSQWVPGRPQQLQCVQPCGLAGCCGSCPLQSTCCAQATFLCDSPWGLKPTAPRRRPCPAGPAGCNTRAGGLHAVRAGARRASDLGGAARRQLHPRVHSPAAGRGEGLRFRVR